MVEEAVRAHLAQFGLADRYMDLAENSATVELAAKALGCEPQRIAKTLAFRRGDGAALIVAAGDARVDNAKFRAYFGERARMLQGDEVLARTGTRQAAFVRLRCAQARRCIWMYRSSDSIRYIRRVATRTARCACRSKNWSARRNFVIGSTCAVGIIHKEGGTSMSENCNHNCENCSENCAQRDPKSFLEAPNALSSIKKVVAIMSGKGGVGKSMVTGLMAVLAQKAGLKTAILDADITGPSIPKMFGVTEKATGDENGIYPAITSTGIRVMSLNLLTARETDPVVWRGPIIAGTVKQFWTDVVWGDVDIMFVDMPPGTGDVPLTVFQSIPVDGILVVTSPQELVGMIVEKAVNMAGLMNIPIFGLIENMSYFTCPDCGKKHSIFGESHIDEIARAPQFGSAG